MILLPLIGIAWKDAGESRRLAPRHWASLGLVLAGIAGYPLYLWSRFGDPFLYVREKSGAAWSTNPGPPWEAAWTIARLVGRKLRDPSEANRLVLITGAACLVGFLVLSVLLIRRRLVAEGLYCAATLLLFASTGTVDGMGRYVLDLFPCFFLIGEWMRRWPVFAFAYGFGGLGYGTVLLHRFVHLVYVG